MRMHTTRGAWPSQTSSCWTLSGGKSPPLLPFAECHESTARLELGCRGHWRYIHWQQRSLFLRYRAILEIAKDASRKLLTGSFNLINLSMPVKMSEPRSYLQKLTDVWVYPR